MKKAIILVLVLFLLFSTSSAVNIGKAVISVDAFGKASAEYTLEVETAKLETLVIQKPISDVFLYDSEGNPLDFRRIEYDKTNEVVFTSQDDVVKIVFETFLLTSKIGEFWYFNTSLSVVPGATILISLPRSAVIESIEGTDRTLTYAGTRALLVESKAGGEHFDLEVKYLIQEAEIEQPVQTGRYFLGFLLVIALFLGLITFLYFKFKTEIKEIKKKSSKKKPKPKRVKGKVIKKSVQKVLDKNEEKVVMYLKEVVDASHSQVHRATKLPKTTLTKVITRLEKRNIVKKVPFGNRNRFSLEGWVFEK